jgi:RHS repeat-associated protein
LQANSFHSIYNYTRAVISNAGNGITQLHQETHYFPFGLEMPTLSKNYTSVVDENRYQYNPETNGIFNSHLFRGSSKNNENRRFSVFRDGKEKLHLNNDNNLFWYDYGARMYDPSLGRWHVLDSRAEKYDSWSPYNYTLNNPVLLIDPKGDTVMFNGHDAGINNAEEQAYNQYKTDLKNIQISSQATIETFNSKGLLGKIGMLGKYTTAKSNFSESTKALGELSKMESASQIFDIQILGGSKNGAILYNQSSGAIDIQVNRNSKSGVIASLAHELKHGFQFLTGEVTFTRRPGETHAISGSLYGPEDEFGAFKRQDLITGGTTNIEDIRATYKDKTNRGGSLKQMTPKQQDRYIRKKWNKSNL